VGRCLDPVDCRGRRFAEDQEDFAAFSISSGPHAELNPQCPPLPIRRADGSPSRWRFGGAGPPQRAPGDPSGARWQRRRRPLPRRAVSLLLGTMRATVDSAAQMERVLAAPFALRHSTISKPHPLRTGRGLLGEAKAKLALRPRPAGCHQADLLGVG